MKMNKVELWIRMCELGIVSGDVSLYRMKGWTKNDMIQAIAEKEKEMKKWYCIAYKEGRPIVGTYVDGRDEEDAELNAEFKIICKFPNVEYDEVRVQHCK